MCDSNNTCNLGPYGLESVHRTLACWKCTAEFGLEETRQYVTNTRWPLTCNAATYPEDDTQIALEIAVR